MRYLFLIVILMPVLLRSQDNHYWNQQFGARQSLLGGTDVAAPDDNAAIYYNPAGLVLIDSTRVSVNASAYRFDRMHVLNGAGNGLDIESGLVNIYPQMISGAWRLKKFPRLSMGYALLTRNFSHYRINTRFESETDVVEDRPGLEEYIGALEFENRLNEQWGCGSAAWDFGGGFSAGLTTVIAYRHQDHHLATDAKTVVPTSSGYYLAGFSKSRDVRFNNIRMLWKAGISLKRENFSVGMTMTTRSVDVYGWAHVQREQSSQNLWVYLPAGQYPDYVIIDRQEGLPAKWKSPWSMAISAAWTPERLKAYVAAEYFGGVAHYTSVSPEVRDIIHPKGTFTQFEDPRFMEVSSLAVPVLNAGIGVGYNFSSKITGYASFRTDFSAFDPDARTEKVSIMMNPGRWNLFHLAGGLTIHQKNRDFTAGLSYSNMLQSPMNAQIVSFTNPKDYRRLFGQNLNIAAYRIWSISGVVGYTHYF